eukprot:76156-Rhodomonas_salina.1
MAPLARPLIRSSSILFVSKTRDRSPRTNAPHATKQVPGCRDWRTTLDGVANGQDETGSWGVTEPGRCSLLANASSTASIPPSKRVSKYESLRRVLSNKPTSVNGTTAMRALYVKAQAS